jgi:hypothetical protein
MAELKTQAQNQTDHLRQAQRKINGKEAKPRKRPDQEAA